MTVRRDGAAEGLLLPRKVPLHPTVHGPGRNAAKSGCGITTQRAFAATLDLMRGLARIGVIASLCACNTIIGFGDLTKQPAGAEPDDPTSTDTKRDAGPQSGGGGGGGNGDGGANAGEDAGDSGPVLASTSCPGTAPDLASYPPWVSPSTRPQPCTQDDLKSFLKTEARPYEEQKSTMAARNAACASCVFTEQSDAVWGPIVHLPDGRMFHAFAICYRLAGASEACAKAAHALEWCSQKVCNICTSGLTLGDCQAQARANECKTFATDTISACQSYGTIVNTTCGGSGNVVGVLCGGI